VPNRGSADSIANELRQHSFSTEQRLGADGENWLVLATHEVVVSEALMRSTRLSMEALIAKFGGGENDGWEAEVQPRATFRLTDPSGNIPVLAEMVATGAHISFFEPHARPSQSQMLLNSI
jgi:hypothetical protein